MFICVLIQLGSNNNKIRQKKVFR
uniref:Uncharacterized protein n=1 Tax=Rhizophora mucronata TaxID=61149 RepID=A0A2P2NE89_RHIMU